jgi:NAD(P)-dependent dehydrogenase (short-subunit alcohol dehydrogenase family)
MAHASKLALVTGGSLGIGKAVARTLARDGMRVIITGRDERRLAATRDELGASGDIHAIVADHATAEGAEATIAGVSAIGDIDVLINNVGVFATRAFTDTSDADWTRMFETNVMSGVRLSRWALPRMLARNSGRIVFVASEQSVRPAVGMTHYAMSKAAQIVIARGLAEETRGTRVTVNSVMPGPTWTEGVEAFIGTMARENGIDVEEMKRRFFAGGDWSSSLIARFLDPDEPAAVVAFLASDAASGVNGAAWRAEGGVTRSIT